MNIYDLISRAQKLRKETQLDSVSPDRVGGLHEDTLKYINEFQLLASSPSLHKAYVSVSAMQSDKSPNSDLTGKPLKPGQLVVIVPANQTDATAGDVYRYDGPSGNTSAWTFVAKIGAVPADAELSATSTNPPQNKVVTEKLTELESNTSRIFRKADVAAYSKVEIDAPLKKGAMVYNMGVDIMLTNTTTDLTGRLDLASGKSVLLTEDKLRMQTLSQAGDVDLFIFFPPSDMATTEDLKAFPQRITSANHAAYYPINASIPAGVMVYNVGVPIILADDTSLTNRIDIPMGGAVYVDSAKARVITQSIAGNVEFFYNYLPKDLGSIADGAITTDKIADGAITTDKAKFISKGSNKFDIRAITDGYYVRNTDGTLIPSAGWQVSGFVQVEEGKTYSAPTFRDYAFYDSNRNYISGVSAPTHNIVAPAGAAYLRTSIYGVFAQDFSITEGSTIIKDGFHHVMVEKVVNNSRTLGAFQASGTLASSERLTTDTINICKNMLISACFEGTIDTIVIGVGFQDYYGKNILITATELRFRGSTDNSVLGTYQHGLTFDKRTIVTIDKGNDAVAKIRIVNGKGDAFEQNVSWGLGVGQPFVYNGGTTSVNVELRFMPRDLAKKVWMFGDSYFGMFDGSRWPYYMLQRGYNQYLLDAKGGENATQGIADLTAILSLGSYPSHILWCHGMNGGRDTNGEVNSAWLTATNNLLALCKSYNITPILATIPSVPSEDHTALNEWIRNSGCRYVDFAKAVEEDGSMYWKGWGTNDALLSADEVHPSVKGALILATQVLIDFPEISVS